MRRLRDLANWLGGEDSSSVVGYAMLLMFIALVVIAALIFLRPITSQIFQDSGCLQCT